MGKLNLPGYVKQWLFVINACYLLAILITTDNSATKTMLENISTTVSQLKKQPTTTYKESVSLI